MIRVHAHLLSSMNTPLDDARELISSIRTHGHTAYIVGGYVRDRVLGIIGKDIDIATSATPDILTSIFGSRVVSEYGSRYGTLLIRSGDHLFETTTYRGEAGSDGQRSPKTITFPVDITTDAARRDFTCNALYYDPITEETIDLFHGTDDLQKGILRWIGDPAERIHEDPLRILRYVRFLHRYGLSGV